MLSLKRLLSLGLAGILLVSAAPVMASQAPRELSLGARGDDVALLQRLLTFRGQPVAITELIGPTTEGLIKEFQKESDLAVTGVVNHVTWRKLYPTLRLGDRGSAVKALQLTLAKKNGYHIHPTGVYDADTTHVVRDFQRHIGIPADGIAGPQTWGALVNHLTKLEQLGRGWYRYRTINPEGHFGTANTIATLQMVAEDWANLGYPQIGVGDISLPHGGPIPGHRSHQEGVDVDIRIFRADGTQAPVDYRNSGYSRKLSQALVDRLLATGEVELILFNDPQVRGVTPWPNHDTHMHVRFRR